MTLRVAIDATPLLGPRTGVGTYVENLIGELAGRDDIALVATALTGRARRPQTLPVGTRWRHLPIPARALRAAWMRTSWPTARVLAGGTDVVHGTNFVLPPPGRAAGVVTVHDLTYERFPDQVAPASLAYRRLVPRAVSRGAIVVTPTRTVRDEVMATYGVESDRVLVTPLGVAPAWSQVRPLEPARLAELGVDTDFVMFLGTREPRKNLSTLLAAQTAFVGSGGTRQLVLVGAAGWGGQLSAPTTMVLPHLDSSTVRGLVASAAAVLMPSTYEGFGLPVVEALAAGTPVVCSDIAVLREVAGECARFVPALDTDAWAAALQDVTSGPDRSDEAAVARRDRAAQFTWARCADATVEAYRLATQS